MRGKNVCLLGFIILALMLVVEAQQSPPSVISFSGTLPGQPDGEIALRLRLFPANTGGTFVFEETQIVNVSGEEFNVLLGNATSGGLPPEIFSNNPSLWIAFALATVPDTEIGSRHPLAAARNRFFTAPSQSVNRTARQMALGLTWTGYADTDLEFSEFFTEDHTLSIRFMPQFPNAYEGPFVAENGSGRFVIGQGDYLDGGEGTKLYLAVGLQSRNYATPLQPDHWYHLAVVVTTTSTQRLFTLYLNGSQLGTPLRVSNNDPQLPSGTLRFGKRTDGQFVNGHNAQFYGLLDDIAVFHRALSGSEIQHLSADVLQLKGNERGLLAGYTFNEGNERPKLSRPLTLNGAAQKVAVSTDRNSEADAAVMPLHTPQVEMNLPFPPGEAWYVIQGYDTANGSHKGYASFCWDFSIADQPQAGDYPNGSKDAPFYASAPGEVVTVKQAGISGTSNPPNLVEVQQAPGEIAGYLHLQQNSAFANVADVVTRGQKLALTGDTGANFGAYHLHFATTDKQDGTPGFVTFPIVFSNYEVRDVTGMFWRRVFKGIPQPGQVIRVPPDPTARYNAVWRRGTTPEIQVEGWKYQDYRVAYDQLWPQGWRLHILQSYVLNSQVLYNAVWRPGTSGEIQVYGWTYQDYRNKYDELWPQGWRLYILQSYVLNGQVLYNAVWRPGTSAEIQVYGWEYKDYRNKYDELWSQGWRLYRLDTYQP